MDSSVERIISTMQAERDVVKELQIKLREANAEKQELQLATEQLRDDVKELRRQLNEAVADSKFMCRLGSRAGLIDVRAYRPDSQITHPTPNNEVSPSPAFFRC